MGGLAISAMGLATPLGGALQAGAASRAGLSRPSPAPDVLVMYPGDDAPQPVSVHALPAATFGFCGVGRLVALLAEALHDLESRSPLAALDAGCRVFVALPDPAERGFEVAGAGPEDGGEARVAALGRTVLDRLEGLGVPLRRHAPAFHGGGELAFARALAAAHRAVAAREAASALVCAADSLADPDALEPFARDGRLKDRESPSGFAPGEAAGVLLLGPAPRGAPPVRLGEPAFREDGWRFGADVPSDGRALADCLARVAPTGEGRPPPVLLSDHDGEQHRARELAVARLVLAGRDRGLSSAEAWYPAVSFGRTGAASGLVATAVAAHALQRGFAPSPRFAILACADDGGRGAFVASRGGA